MTRQFFLTHSPINAMFTKNSSDFVVSEIPLYPFSGEGEHLVLHVRKKDLTTWDMLQYISEVTGCKVRDFGYAGLKDKDGMTTQYISLHKSYEPKLANFTHDKIKILDKTYHNNKIRTGHLKGNRFFVRLKKVNPIDAPACAPRPYIHETDATIITSSLSDNAAVAECLNLSISSLIEESLAI